MSAIKPRPTKKQRRQHRHGVLPRWAYKLEYPPRNGNGSKYDPNTEDAKHDKAAA